jgi:hypothetical protein
MTSCDVTDGQLLIMDGSAECSGVTLASSSVILISGTVSTTVPSPVIQVIRSRTVLVFENVDIAAPAPFESDGSHVTVILSGSNHFTSTTSTAVSCVGLSNLTFLTHGGGSLSAASPAFGGEGDQYGPGIGAPTLQQCAHLHFFNGTYNLEGGLKGAGIGTGSPQGGVTSVDSITIDGGVFTAVGGTYAAGIGTGGSGEPGGLARVGRILIRGGTIAASSRGVAYGAGVGTGCAYDSDALIENLTIEHGKFELHPQEGAGIGTGSSHREHERANPTNRIAHIAIKGGEFRIATVSSGTGIGAGCARQGLTVVNQIVIDGGIFDIDAGFGSAIGAGGGYWGISGVDLVSIHNGSFRLSADSAAAIGAGYGYHEGRSYVNRIAITGGFFEIDGPYDRNGAGIGAGYGYSNGTSRVETIAISGGTFNISAGGGGAGIGAALTYANGHSIVGNVSISHCVINASSRAGAGIGTGNAESGNSTISSLTIENAIVRAASIVNGSAIGGGPASQAGTTGPAGNSTIDRLVIRNSSVTALSLHGAAIGSGVTTVGFSLARQIEIADSSIVAITPNGSAFGSAVTVYSRLTFKGALAIESDSSRLLPSISGLASVTLDHAHLTARTTSDIFFGLAPILNNATLLIVYAVPSLSEPLAALPVLHIGRVDWNGFAATHLTFATSGGSETFAIASAQAAGFLVSLRRTGTYTASFESNGAVRFLSFHGSQSFTVNPGENYYGEVTVVTPPPPSQRPNATPGRSELSAHRSPTESPAPTRERSHSATASRSRSLSATRSRSETAPRSHPATRMQTASVRASMTDQWVPQTTGSAAAGARALSGGTIAGISIAVVGVIGAAIVVIVIVVRRRGQTKEGDAALYRYPEELHSVTP